MKLTVVRESSEEATDWRGMRLCVNSGLPLQSFDQHFSVPLEADYFSMLQWKFLIYVYLFIELDTCLSAILYVKMRHSQDRIAYNVNQDVM